MYVRRRRLIRRTTRYPASGYAKGRRVRTRGRLYHTRRKLTYRSKRTRKRILNTTSTKKYDTMLTWSGVPDVTPTSGAVTIPAAEAVPQIFIWSPTMRLLSNSTKGTVSYNIRTKSETFAVGCAERMSVIVDDSTPWIWRRICFSIYGADIWNVSGTYYPPWFAAAPTGYARYFQNLGGASVSSIQLALQNQLFKAIFRGQRSVDWSNPLMATTRKEGVRIWSDTTQRVESLSDNGTFRFHRRYHRLMKRLRYDDNETGDDVDSTFYSINDRASLGDFLIMDIFGCADNAADSNLTINSDATYYWHEK